VFVHGYNVTFENAARRTAQMAYDLAFEGAAILYSWPSKGSITGYPVDGTNVQWSTPHLKTFLADVATRTGAQTVHLIAHSMGNRALAGALQSLLAESRAEIHSVFREIVLTAPDIDADIFRRDIAPRLANLPARVTLYASSADKALQASKTYHQYPRAGDSAADMAVIEKIDAIDATAVETGFLGHSYYADNRSVIADLFYLLREGKPPAERFALERVSAGQGVYWRFKK
jgi:esterase/lipase superfamily enzyme